MCTPFAFHLITLLQVAGTSLHAQASAAPACTDSIGGSMAFLQGDWTGRSYSVAGRDTVLDGHMTVHSEALFGDCALQESWKATKDGSVLFTAKVTRAYDASTKHWMVYYVDDGLNSQIYDGRLESGEWRFFRTRMDGSVPVQVRLTWRPRDGGYEQLIERSRDGGATWTLGGFVRFERGAGSR